MKLSILIPTIEERSDLLSRLVNALNEQMGDYRSQIEILINKDGGTIGAKRNRLLEKASGEYTAFIDDDDLPSEHYIKTCMEGIEKGVDCISLKGVLTTNGNSPELFEHSLKYKEWKTTPNEIKYERYPNHLNCIKASISKRFKFPESNFGEDRIWSDQLHQSGLLQTEYYTDHILYHYLYNSK